MRVIRIAEVEHVPIDTATPIPGWTGGEVRRTRQPLLPEGSSKSFNSSVVNFERGATTGWHVHTSDQILVITAGIGMVVNVQCQRGSGVLFYSEIMILKYMPRMIGVLAVGSMPIWTQT